MARQRLIAIAGPTASGKTALSIELSRRISGEVVSCDSMMSLVYRGMDIGTAKPTRAEMDGIPHHMIETRTWPIRQRERSYFCGALPR